MRLLILLIALGASLSAHAAELKTRNVFLIMTDGLRWQEVFSGAEERLITTNNGFAKDTNAIRSAFWRRTPEERREALLPFMWTEIAQRGQVFGNQAKGSVVRVANGKNFSYPGYNEILTGAPDKRIDSNNKIPNPNINVFEWLNEQSDFLGKCAIFATWDVFPYIFNAQRSGLPIWPDWDEKFVTKISLPKLIDDLNRMTPRMWSSVAYDSFAMEASLDCIQREKPRVVFVGFGETDERAHSGKYDEYLKAAHAVDKYIARLWQTLQSIGQYKDKTTLIITSDHGRGHGEHDWKDHGEKTPGSDGDWIAVLGPDTKALGERERVPALTVGQIPATMAELLGKDYRRAFSQAGEPIRDVIGK